MSTNMTVQEVAKQLRVHENTIYGWLMEGGIFPNAFRIKKGWRIPSSDVHRAKKSPSLCESDNNRPSESGKPISSKARQGFVSRWKS